VIDASRGSAAGNEIFPFAAIGMKTQDLKYKGGAPRLEIGETQCFSAKASPCIARTNDARRRSSARTTSSSSRRTSRHDCILGNHIIIVRLCGLRRALRGARTRRFSGATSPMHQFGRIATFDDRRVQACAGRPPFMIVDGNPAKRARSTRSASNAMAFPTRRSRVARRLQNHLPRKPHHDQRCDRDPLASEMFRHVVSASNAHLQVDAASGRC